jgi:hypothetical protein
MTIRLAQEQYEDQLVSIIRHTDDAYPHLQAYVLRQPRRSKRTCILLRD